MSNGYRELLDLIQAIKATPGWRVDELKTRWRVWPPLSGTPYVIPHIKTPHATVLRNIGKDLKKLGWTEEIAQQAVREAAREKTKTARAKANRKIAQAEVPDEKPTQAALPLYEANVVGGPEHMPPGPMGDGKPYGVDSVLVGPELAAKFKATNLEDNRPLSDEREAEIAADILAGRWKQNGARIRFCLVRLPDGQLVQRMVDGYTRMCAIEKAGIAVPVDLYYNMPYDALSTVDIERPRSAGNSLHMLGVPNANMIAAGIKMVWFYDTKRSGRWSIRVSNPHVVELYNEDPQGWQDEAKYVGVLLKNTANDDKRIFVQRSLLSAYYVCKRAYPKNPRLTEFFDGVVTSLGIPRDVGDPRYKLRRLLKNEATTGVTKNAKRHFALIIIAYNSFMTKDYKIPIVWSDRESVPDPVMGG